MGTVALAPGLSRKLKKVLECHTESPDVLASLDALSLIYNENTPQARRNLRSTIERRSLQLNLDFLEAYDTAQQALDRVETEVNSLAECCDMIENALNSCSCTTRDIISTTDRLKQDLEIATQRCEIVSCFLRDYQLSIDEINALRDEDLNEGFFRALSRAQEIHANCKMLLRTHHQRAGLELMDMMAVYQEGAYEHLCRWVQAECRKLGDTDNPDVGDILKMAVRCLKERPILFKYCAEEAANMRHHSLFRRFISALTRGGPGGFPRPIEVNAHDPLRYVGDMLGWLHQALASERELVHALFHPDAAVDACMAASQFPISEVADNGGGGSLNFDAAFVLDRVFEGVCRPFKVRVEQVLQSQPSLIIAYKLCNTLEFYGHTMSDLLGKEAALCDTLQALKDAAQKTFFSSLSNRGEKLLRYPPLVGADLSPPDAVGEGVSLLLEIMEIYSCMMVPASQPKPDFDPVISALLDPIIQTCEQAAEAHKSKSLGLLARRRMSSDLVKKSPADALLLTSSAAKSSQNDGTPSKIFLLNCLCAIQQPLQGHEAAAKYVEKLGSMIDQQTDDVVEREVDAILSKCGLAGKVKYVRGFLAGEASPSCPLAEDPEMAPASISEGLGAFFGLVFGSESCTPGLELVHLPALRSEVCARVASALYESYQLIYAAIMDPQNGFSDPKSLARHHPDQIKTVLGI